MHTRDAAVHQNSASDVHSSFRSGEQWNSESTYTQINHLFFAEPRGQAGRGIADVLNQADYALF